MLKRLFLFTAFLSLFFADAVNCFAQNNAQSKARYYLLSGMVEEANENYAEAYELYKKAHSIDAENPDAAINYALGLNVLEHKYAWDSIAISHKPQSLKLMKQYIDKYPTDIHFATFYANMNAEERNFDEAILTYNRLIEKYPKYTNLLLALADVYTDKNDIPASLEILNKYEDIEGKSPRLSMLKMYYILQQGDTLGMIQEGRNLLDTNPKNPEYVMLMGYIYASLQMRDSAMNWYQRAEKMDPGNGRVKLEIANIYHALGDSTAYDEKIYQSLLAEDLDLQQKLTILTPYLQVLVADKSDSRRGDNMFNVLREQYPYEPAILELASQYAAARRNWDEALEYISYAIDLAPGNTNYIRQKMGILIMAEKYEEVYEIYENLSDNREKPDRQIIFLVATAAQLNKDWQRAVYLNIDLLQNILPGIEPTTDVLKTPGVEKLSYEELMEIATYLNVLGDIYHEMGDIPASFKCYDNSLSIYPSNPAVLNNYAYFITMLDDGDLNKALSMSENATKLEPHNPTYLDTLAWVLYSLGRYEEALEIQQQAIDIAEREAQELPNPADADMTEYFEHMGQILLKLGRDTEGNDFLQRAESINKQLK